MLKVNKKHTTCQIYLKLTIKTTAKSGASIVNFGHILHFIIIIVEFNQMSDEPEKL